MSNKTTLAGVLVVLLIGVGASLLLLANRVVIRDENRYFYDTVNHLRCLLEAQIGYSSDAGTWAYPAGFPVPDGSDPAMVLEYIGRTYVVLARAAELPAKLFINPCCPVKPTPEFDCRRLSYEGVLGQAGSSPHEDNLTRDETLRWAASFAYDISAPMNSASGRPVFADRSPSVWGGDGVLVAYGDGHVSYLKALPVGLGVPRGDICVVTEDLTVVPQTQWNVVSCENDAEDWLYKHDQHHEQFDCWQPGRGSSTLAWLR